MSKYVTYTELDTALKKQTDEIVGVLHGFMGQVDERFNKIESRTDRFEHWADERFNKLEARMSKFDRKLDSLTNTIDAFVKRLDDIETEQIARDRQFSRLLAWAHKVSEKTGIPLDSL